MLRHARWQNLLRQGVVPFSLPGTARREPGRHAEELRSSSEDGDGADPTFPASLARLTSREIEVLSLVAEGFANAAIARKLCVSSFTVRNHVQNILGKLGLHSKAEAVGFAFKKHLLQ